MYLRYIACLALITSLVASSLYIWNEASTAMWRPAVGFLQYYWPRVATRLWLTLGTQGKYDRCVLCAGMQENPDPANGPSHPDIHERRFGKPASDIRVHFYRDHAAWCPYCQMLSLDSSGPLLMGPCVVTGLLSLSRLPLCIAASPMLLCSLEKCKQMQVWMTLEEKKIPCAPLANLSIVPRHSHKRKTNSAPV